MQAIFGPFLLSCSSGFLASRDRVFSAPPLFALSQSFVHDAPKISFVTTKFGQDVPEEFVAQMGCPNYQTAFVRPGPRARGFKASEVGTLAR